MGLWTWAFGVDDDIEAGDNATRQLKELAFKKYQAGTYDLKTYQEVIARLDGNLAESAAADDAIQGAFVEGAQEGLNNIASTIQSATSWSIGGIWKLIPWQVKVLALLVVLWYAFQFYKTGKLLLGK